MPDGHDEAACMKKKGRGLLLAPEYCEIRTDYGAMLFVNLWL